MLNTHKAIQRVVSRTRWQIEAVGGRVDLTDLPTLYDKQREIKAHPATRKVICAGRRFGKTILAAEVSVGYLLDGKRVLLSSTSQDQADTFWEYITYWLGPLIEAKSLYKNESKRIIRHHQTGGQIRVKTGRDPDALRGGWADLLVLDECAYLQPDAWSKVGAPMLADTGGSAWFISTPKRRNWFFELFTKADSGDDARWHAWHATTLANPHLTEEAIDALAADMNEEDYQQEILAQFLEGQGAVFRYVDARCTAQKREPYAGSFVAGVDWAREHDYTVMVIMDRETRTVVDYDRFNQVDFTIQRPRIQHLYERWKPETILAESNSIGMPNIEILQQQGLPVRAFETTPSSKPPLIESLVLAFDRGEITHLDDPVIKGEFMAYERKVSPSGRSQYSAPEGLHDDTVIATALANWGCLNSFAGAAAFDLPWEI